MSAPRRNCFRPCIEALEDRRLMTADVASALGSRPAPNYAAAQVASAQSTAQPAAWYLADDLLTNDNYIRLAEGAQHLPFLKADEVDVFTGSLLHKGNANIKVQIDSEQLEIGPGQNGAYLVFHNRNGTKLAKHAAGAPVYLAGAAIPAASHMGANLVFFPEDDVTPTAAGQGLVLISHFRTPPLDFGEPSKVATVKVNVKDWSSQTAQSVELFILDGAGNPILLPSSIPNNLPNGLNVNPAVRYKANLISAADPTNWHNPGVHDIDDHNFVVKFSVLPNQASTTTPITLVVRQGAAEVRLHMALVVVGAPTASPGLGTPLGTTGAARPSFAWTTVKDADKFEIQVQDRSNNNQVVADATVKGTGWQPTSNLIAGHTYAWRVRGISDKAGAGPWSNFQTFTVVSATPPAAPGQVVASVLNSNQIALSWAASPGATGYTLWKRKTSDTKFTAIGTMAAGVTRATLTGGFDAGTTYYFAVGASNAYGQNFGYSAATTMPASQALAAPGALTYRTLSSSQIELSWANVAGESGYRVEYWNGQSWVELSRTAADVTHLTITNAKGYYFRVSAFNAAGTKYSDWVQI